VRAECAKGSVPATKKDRCEDLLDRVMAAVEKKTAKMTPTQREKADADLEEIAERARSRESSATQL
jgi:hypothetical protein